MMVEGAASAAAAAAAELLLRPAAGLMPRGEEAAQVGARCRAAVAPQAPVAHGCGAAPARAEAAAARKEAVRARGSAPPSMNARGGSAHGSGPPLQEQDPQNVLRWCTRTDVMLCSRMQLAELAEL